MKNVYRRLSTLTCIGTVLRVERSLISAVANICRQNGVSAQVDDESLESDKPICTMVVVADGPNAESAYMYAGWDLHTELGIDLP